MASRPLSGSAARRVWRPLLRAACRSAALCSHSSRRRRREQRFVVDEINAALRGMGLRIVEPRASEICFALQSCRLPALLTMRVHHQVISFDMLLLGTQHLNHNDVLFPRHLLLHSCRGTTPTVSSTLRSWISTTLLVRADKRKENEKPHKTFCSSGCPPASCVRFAATASCPSPSPSGSDTLICSGSNVTSL
jgi:hypothetical protein